MESAYFCSISILFGHFIEGVCGFMNEMRGFLVLSTDFYKTVSDVLVPIVCAVYCCTMFFCYLTLSAPQFQHFLLNPDITLGATVGRWGNAQPHNLHILGPIYLTIHCQRRNCTQLSSFLRWLIQTFVATGVRRRPLELLVHILGHLPLCYLLIGKSFTYGQQSQQPFRCLDLSPWWSLIIFKIYRHLWKKRSYIRLLDCSIFTIIISHHGTPASLCCATANPNMHSESQVSRGPLCTTTDLITTRMRRMRMGVVMTHPVSMLKAEAVARESSSPKAAIPNLPHFSANKIQNWQMSSFLSWKYL